MYISKKKGITLIEATLVLGISIFIGFVAFSQILKNQEFTRADMAGFQIKLIGDSVNAYITNHYDSLSTLTNATESSTDLGPRTCTTANNTCAITVKTLVNEGLLPSSYSGKNVYGYGYSILLKRTGVAPYYKIYGLITTDTSLMTGNSIRYDLLGEAMQKAGIDSGMTRNSSSQVSGFNGSWTANSSDYTNINKSGQLAYQAGYGTYNYSVFLRRDGTLPMTGNLNMGGNNLYNAQNITAAGLVIANNLKSISDSEIGGNIIVSGKSTLSGSVNALSTINAGGDISTDKEIIAHNGYGDAIKFGGDSGGGDYDITLMANKPLTIYSPKVLNSMDTVFRVRSGSATFENNAIVSNKFSTNGYDPNDIPAGWGGGIRTFDVVSSGTVALIKRGTSAKDGNLAAYMNMDGNIYASGNLNIDNNAYINGSINSGGDINVGKRLNAYEYIYINGVAVSGTSCSQNGLQGRSTDGMPVYCINGVWQRGNSVVRLVTNTATNADWVQVKCNNDEIAIGGGGTSYGGNITFKNSNGNNVAPGMDASKPLDDLSGWMVSGMNANPGDTLNVYAVCMKK